MATWQQTYNRLKKKKELLDNTNNTLEISKTILGSNIAPIKTTNTFNSTSNITSTLKPTIDFAPFGTKQGIASVGEEIENKIKTPTEVLKEEKKKSVFSQTTDDDDSYIKKAESKVIKDYASMSKEELKKEEENILKKQNELSKTKDYRKKNREWWDKDDGIIRNLGNVVYKSVLEKDPYDYSDEYNELTARYNAIQKVKQGNYVENKEYDKGLSGALEKSTDTFMGGMMSSLRGLEGTTKKILGNEENISEKTMIEKLGDKAYQETDSGLGKFGLDISRGIGQQAPMLFASGVGAGAKLTTALAGTSFGGMAYNQAKEEGFTEEQATKYGVGVGVLETMLNKILPSYNINGKNVFGKTATDKLTSKMMSKVAGNEFLKRTLTSGAGEFTEEYLQEFLDPIMRETLLEEDNDVGIKDAEGIKDLAKNIASYTAQNFFSKENAYAGLLGFVTSSTLGAQSNIDAHRAVKGAQQQAVADAETELGRKLTKEEEQQINLEVQNAFNEAQQNQGQQEVEQAQDEVIQPTIQEEQTNLNTDVNSNTLEQQLETQQENVETNKISQDIQEDINEFKLGKESSYESINADRFKEMMEAVGTKTPKAFNNVLEVGLDGGVRVKSGTSRKQLDTIYNAINDFKSKIETTQETTQQETQQETQTEQNISPTKEEHFTYNEYGDVSNKIDNIEQEIKKEIDKQYDDEREKLSKEFDDLLNTPESEINVEEKSKRLSKLQSLLNGGLRNKYDTKLETELNNNAKDLITRKKELQELFDKNLQEQFNKKAPTQDNLLNSEQVGEQVEEAIAPVKETTKINEMSNGNGVNTEYHGKFNDGTPEQLERAQKNLDSRISSETKTVNNLEKMSGKYPEIENKYKFHKDNLESLKLQNEELQREKAKRDLTDGIASNTEQTENIAPIKKELEKVTKQLNETIKEVKKVAKDTKELTKDLKPLKNLEEDINPFVEMFRNETKANIEDIAKDVEYVADNWKNLKKSNEQGIENNDPYQAFVDNQLTKKVDSKAQTKINKPKVKDNILKRAFTNINADIDRFSDETGNKMIKIYGDQVNNSFGEITANINKNQTDNNGKSIGKGIKPIFKQAKDKGLYEAFNDYLFHLSNVARHKQGKGSLVPEVESARLILEYETEYPEMKKWANEANKYNRNNLYKQVDAGLIKKHKADKITNMYDFYVPFMEDIQRNYVNQETYEIKPRSTVKFARGGADKNLLPFEEAMIKQTQSTISTIRKNQLYQEIIKSSKEKTDIGADLRDNINDLSDSLYVDENGYYLTGYVNGERQSVKIDEGLYKSLKNEMGEKTKNLEAKFSKTAKALQTISNIRRNMLTTWNPFFLITNTVKDAQDSPLNSKYAKDWAVNYPKALKEITMGKGEHLDEFLNLYGNTGVMGDYNIDSGVSDITKTVKTKTTNNAKKFLTPAGLNEISELTPRYAEYLASIKNGVSPMEAIYNAREVTINFGRSGWLIKFLNRNGFTFLNPSVQGFSKLGRNFTDNGVKGAVQMSAKAVTLGMAPALLNALMFGLGDDEDEDYKVLPDYVKDNYYLFKTDDGDFIRIPKGRMISIFGSASRRALELANGEKDAFDGYLKNTYSQVGVSNPMESNILAPILQATDGESGKTWYGEDLVPSRLQKKPAEQQYDESIDKFSIWAGQKLGISPYKLNYVLDQYSGGIGDMIIPTITDEAQSENDSVLGIALAPFKDKFTADSTTDNKNVGDFYSKSEELEKKSNSDYATDEDKLISSYMYSVSGEMSELYKERREVQNDDSLTKSEKYRKSQAIKDEINALAKEGLDGYKNVDKSSNYAEVGGRGFYKYVDDKTGQTRWGRPKEDEMDELNSMGLTTNEKSTYYGVKNEIGEVYDKYKDTDDYDNKKKDIVNTISNASLNDDTKYYLYDKYYGSTEELEAIKMVGIGADDYFKYASNTFKADKDENGKSISGSKKTKVFDYINSMDIGFEQKAILAKLEYNTYDEWNNEIIDYLNNDDNITYEEMEKILKQLGFEIDSSGVISW